MILSQRFTAFEFKKARKGEESEEREGRKTENRRMEVKRINVCLIGTGRMGKIRAKILYGNPLTTIVGMISKANGVNVAALYQVPHFSSLEAFQEYWLERKQETQDDADLAFVITSSTSVHREHISSICRLQLGKWIFIEKPISGTPSEIREMFALSRKSGIELCCGFQRRFDASYVKLKQAITAGAVGTPSFARVFFADHPVPELKFLLQDGCPFMDLTPHDIDFVRWCLDDEVESISASSSSTLPELKKHNVLDNGVINIKFKKGCLVNIYFNRSCSYGYDQRCEFFGSKGCLSVENIATDAVQLCDETGVKTSTLQYSFPQRFQQAFEKEIEVFIQVCLNQATWPITETDCVETQKIAMAAAKANAEGTVLQYSDIDL